MIKFGKQVVKYGTFILILGILLLIPSVIGYANTKVNYDMLYYLPDDIETMQGQQILLDEFGTGAFSFLIVHDMEDKDVIKIKEQIEEVEHVSKVLWYDSLFDISTPKELLPESVYQAFNAENSTMMAVIFDDGTSGEGTMDAIKEVKGIAGKQCFLSGISAIVTDTKDLSNKETPIYVCIAVLISCAVLAIFMDSYLIPLFFLLSIGFAIVYNLGSNYFLGEISYITKALSAVLQLGVTMDYSIFLWHSYEEQQQRFPGDKNRAMAHAISNTITSVVGSSVTTVAGFIALCFMSFTLGKDLGIVMAKGVVFGVISCVTILPAMLLTFDKGIEKTKHKDLIPDISGVSKFITKHYKVFLVLFLVLLFPAIYGYRNTTVYYDLSETLPESLDSVKANHMLEEEYNMNSMHIALVDSNLDARDVKSMLGEFENVDGVKYALGLESVIGPAIPQSFLPDSLTGVLKGDRYELLLISSEYKVGSNEVNTQCDLLNNIIKKYDPNGMLVGEAPCTKDLITITDNDFKVVSAISIGVIFLIIAVLFRSVSLPVLLVAVIEFAIFINMGIPCYTGTELPFIASIVIGTIQLGATVDYAILMTTRYRKERNKGAEKKDAIQIALGASVKSIIVSALSFFAATFGVGLYSNIDMISSLCILMARGALISMAVVLTVLPSMFLIFDKVICKTSKSFLKA